jgi:hypothetical protein
VQGRFLAVGTTKMSGALARNLVFQPQRLGDVNRMKLLHCMKKSEYLEQALCEGLMMRNHEVKFSPAEDPEAWATLIDQILPLLKQKLKSLGVPFDSLSEETRLLLLRGIGSNSGFVPMICLTEVPDGRNVDGHQIAFGSYGLVISRHWVESNGGDRVLYVGHNSASSRRLFVTLAAMKIFSLHVGARNQVLFDNEAFRASLDLLCYVEAREHLEQAEWRLAGNPGWIGGGTPKEIRLNLPIEKIETVLVKNDAEIQPMSALVRKLADKQKSQSSPQVTVFSRQLP